MVQVRIADGDDVDRWDDLVERSPHGTPFHRHGALEVLAEHSGTTLYPLVGYKGQEPVGVFPVFERSVGPATAAFSPPPGLKVSYGGPALVNFGKLKRRKAEKRHRRFVEGCLDLLEDRIDPGYVHVRTATRYSDTRSFGWRGFDADPGYTYVVDLEPGPEDLLMAFSSDARRNVRNGTGDDGPDWRIEEGGPAAVERIVAQVRARHEEQGESYGVTPGFVTDLRRALPEGVVRAYECTVEGSFAGGMVTLETGDTVYRWQGGARTDGDVPVNDLVDWRIIRDAVDRGLTRYDLVGANERRITEYKAKFAPELETYHELERSTRPMRVVKGLYTRLR